MVHVFLLVSLFSNLNAPVDVAGSGESMHSKETPFVEVHFDKLPLVTVGDPVLFNGAVVGSISKIQYDQAKQGSTNVSLRLSNENLPLGDSIVALVGSVKTGVEGKNIKKRASSSNRSFLELLALKSGGDSKNGVAGVVRGFTSFQEFWASKFAI